jgi:hypothetical protein
MGCADSGVMVKYSMTIISDETALIAATVAGAVVTTRYGIMFAGDSVSKNIETFLQDASPVKVLVSTDEIAAAPMIDSVEGLEDNRLVLVYADEDMSGEPDALVRAGAISHLNGSFVGKLLPAV